MIVHIRTFFSRDDVMSGPDIWLAGTVDECISLAQTGLVQAIVTNPTVIASWCSTHGSYAAVIRHVCGHARRPLFVQLQGPSTRDFLEQFDTLRSLSPLAKPKLPATLDGLAATARLAETGIDVLVTAMGSLGSIATAASAGARWVCPYISRTREAGTDPIAMIRDASALLERVGSPTRIVPASVRTLEDAQAVLAAGAHGLIVFAPLWKQLIQDAVCTQAIQGFAKDWNTIHQADQR
jgi:transaldolase